MPWAVPSSWAVFSSRSSSWLARTAKCLCDRSRGCHSLAPLCHPRPVCLRRLERRLSRVRRCLAALFLVCRPRRPALAVGGALRGRPRVLPLHRLSGAAL
ncbi:hypothetical protein BU14_0452s0014 [Porphyra umbilicalis]|uniref:Uncharacterized protein n=1 Tax=Porphyra umbilicalis TaxID=2786 RepID=A0A1X6NUG3_PORUM|nr:hypothetical protein BU14_0452s0014 [Porphyra umbilicalis]|eukprot:OSX72269.1 hypothetical protein BU14_0452s0014 [Porphyra umbilicalis]